MGRGAAGGFGMRCLWMSVALGAILRVGAQPEFMRRGLQQMEPECVDAISREPGKKVDEVARCAATCMDEVEQLRALDEVNAAKTAWDAADAQFTEDNEHGLPGSSHCRECVIQLQECASTTLTEQRAQAARSGDGQNSGGWMRLDLTADDFTCLATLKWGDEATEDGEVPEQTLRFSMPGLCFPAVCSYADIQDLFKYDMFATGRIVKNNAQRANAQGSATCDIAATFVDDSAPWWILAFSFFFVVGNVALSTSSNPAFLRCMLWCYMAFDIAVGLGLIVYGFLVLSHGNMPNWIKYSFPLFGAVQVLIGGVLSTVMDSGDSRGIKTGICSCLAGKTWLLYFSNVLALVHGIICLVVAIVYKVTGKASVEGYIDNLDDTEAAMRYAQSCNLSSSNTACGAEHLAGCTALCSVDDKEEVLSFLQMSQTLMVILLIISAALQFSTIALSTGCPCALAIAGESNLIHITIHLALSNC